VREDKINEGAKGEEKTIAALVLGANRQLHVKRTRLTWVDGYGVTYIKIKTVFGFGNRIRILIA
jgi:hypothetical protein